MALAEKQNLIPIGEVYFNHTDIRPTQALLESSAAILEQHAREFAREILGSGFDVVIESAPGSLIDRCIVFGGLFLAIASTTPSQLGRNIEEWRTAINQFSEAIVESVGREPLIPGHRPDQDRSVVVQRKTHALGKIDRILDAARNMRSNPTSSKARQDLLDRIQSLAREASNEEERRDFLKSVDNLPGVEDALRLAFGSDYQTTLWNPPPKKARVRNRAKSPPKRAPKSVVVIDIGLPEPKLHPVVRRFST